MIKTVPPLSSPAVSSGQPAASAIPHDLEAAHPVAPELSSAELENSGSQETPVAIQLSLPVENEPITEPSPPGLSDRTLELASQDVRTVLREQNDQSHTLTTKLNILFVANGALLTSLTISRLIVSGSLFSVAEILGFLISFSLLMRAFLPRQVAVTPNLEDQNFLETYLAFSPEDYQLQMLVNLAETYKSNKQRLEDISQSLKYAAYTIWGTTAIMLVNIVVVYVTKSLQVPML